MTIRPKQHLLLPLLALSMTLALVASVHAQDRRVYGSTGSSATLQVSFGSTPRWTGIRGTRVSEIRQAQRPDYDMFRYGGRYYVYNNNRWYSSRRSQGQFAAIDDRSVPREFSKVPSDHWRNYPQGWQRQDNNPPASQRRNR